MRARVPGRGGRSVDRGGRSVNIGALVVIAGAIAVWEVIQAANLFSGRFLPTPWQAATALGDLLTSSAFASALGHTAETTAIATASAIVSGVAIGLAMGLSAAVRTYSSSTVDFLRTMPLTALLPVALVIWGPSNIAEIAIAWYAAVWPVVVNTASGVRSIHGRLYDVARVMGFGRWMTLRKIVMPAVTGSILIGARLGAIGALVMSIVAEMLINPQGLGWNLIVSQNAIQPNRVWAYTIVIGILAYVLNLALVGAVKWAMPGTMRRLEEQR